MIMALKVSIFCELSCFVVLVVGTKLNVSQGDLTEKSLSMNLCRCTREITQCLICRQKGLLCSPIRLFQGSITLC